MGSPGGVVDCVFLSGLDHEVRCIASMLGPGRIRVHGARTLEMADFLLLATGGTVLVLDSRFPGGGWRDALAMMRTVHPHAAAVICADAGERLEQAAELGALDVLWRPLDIERLRASIRTAHEVATERERGTARMARGAA